MKKLLLLVIILINLPSCTYSFDGQCFIPLMPVVPPDCYKGRVSWPYIALFQKQSTMGNTDSELRWKDAVSCDGIIVDKAKNDFKIKNSRNEKGIMIPKVVDDFEQCMSDKGYLRLNSEICGAMNPKWDKGKCNI